MYLNPPAEDFLILTNKKLSNNNKTVLEQNQVDLSLINNNNNQKQQQAVAAALTGCQSSKKVLPFGHYSRRNSFDQIFEDNNIENLFQQQSESYQPNFDNIFQQQQQQQQNFEDNLFNNNEQSSSTTEENNNNIEFEFPAFDSFIEPKEEEQQQQESTEPAQQQQQQQQIQIDQAQIFKVTQKIAKNKLKKKQRDYDKNICRYLARQIVRCFVDKTYRQEVTKFCLEINSENACQLYESSTMFLLSKIEFITGHRAFQDILVFEENEAHLQEKKVFRKFTYWFLKERAFRYIITGNMTDKKQYLKFKNEIMLFYVQRPERWNANAVRKTRKRN